MFDAGVEEDNAALREDAAIHDTIVGFSLVSLAHR